MPAVWNNFSPPLVMRVRSAVTAGLPACVPSPHPPFPLYGAAHSLTYVRSIYPFNSALGGPK